MKTQTQTQKLLIKDNKGEADREIAILKSMIPTLNQLKEIYESLDLCVLDEKTALSLLSDRGATAGEMFLNAIAADALSTSKNKHFINQIVKSQENTVNNFKAEVKKVLDEVGYFNSSRFNYSELNGYYLSKESLEIIKESKKIFLNNPEEIKLFKSFESALESLESLRTEIERYSGANYNHLLTPILEREGFDRVIVLSLNIEKVLELIRDLKPKK
jgi:hypothetical protein